MSLIGNDFEPRVYPHKVFCSECKLPIIAGQTALVSVKDGKVRKIVCGEDCRQPFSELQAWVNRFILHGDGVMLVPARVEVSWFWKLWRNCDAIFLSKGPIKYICPEGKSPPRFFGGAFCAMGQQNAQRLRAIPLRGVLITSRELMEAENK